MEWKSQAHVHVGYIIQFQGKLPNTACSHIAQIKWANSRLAGTHYGPQVVCQFFKAMSQVFRFYLRIFPEIIGKNQDCTTTAAA